MRWGLNVSEKSESNLNVIIYDGMALVNTLEIGKDCSSMQRTETYIC